MRIIATEELSIQRQQEVEALQEIVHSREGLQRRLFLTNRLNVEQKLPCFFLAYQAQQLVGFLLAFFPTPEEVEISGYTHPDYRNQGIFSRLLRRTLTEYASLPFSQVLLLVEERSESGKAFLASRAPHRVRSEFVLSLTKEQFIPADAPKGELLQVQHHSRESAARLMSEIFDNSLSEALERISLMLLEGQERQIFIYRYRNQSIGVLNAQRNEDRSFSLYGVGVLPAFRGRGHATAMLQLALTELFCKTEEIRLEVESTNEAAIDLYERVGFTPAFSLHFHRYIHRQ